MLCFQQAMYQLAPDEKRRDYGLNVLDTYFNNGVRHIFRGNPSCNLLVKDIQQCCCEFTPLLPFPFITEKVVFDFQECQPQMSRVSFNGAFMPTKRVNMALYLRSTKSKRKKKKVVCLVLICCLNSNTFSKPYTNMYLFLCRFCLFHWITCKSAAHLPDIPQDVVAACRERLEQSPCKELFNDCNK